MTKVVYEKKAKTQKRYIVQFRDIRYRGDWITYSETFRFKWVASFWLLSCDTKYDHRVVDTND